MKVIVPVFDGEDLGVDLINSFTVCASCGMQSIVIEPFAILLKKLQDGRYIFSLDVLFMRVDEIFLPLVQHRLEFILSLVCFENDSVLVEHFAFKSEILLKFLFSVEVKLLSLEFNWS